MSDIIKIKNLNKWYGDFHVFMAPKNLLNEISLT